MNLRTRFGCLPYCTKKGVSLGGPRIGSAGSPVSENPIHRKLGFREDNIAAVRCIALVAGPIQGVPYRG